MSTKYRALLFHSRPLEVMFSSLSVGSVVVVLRLATALSLLAQFFVVAAGIKRLRLSICL